MMNNIFKIIGNFIDAVLHPANDETRFFILTIFLGGILTTLLIEFLILIIIKIIKKIKYRS